LVHRDLGQGVGPDDGTASDDVRGEERRPARQEGPSRSLDAHACPPVVGFPPSATPASSTRSRTLDLPSGYQCAPFERALRPGGRGLHRRRPSSEGSTLRDTPSSPAPAGTLPSGISSSTSRFKWQPPATRL